MLKIGVIIFILFEIFFSFIFVYCKFTEKELWKFSNRKLWISAARENIFSLREENGLADQGLLWLAILFPASVAIVIAEILFWDTHFDLSRDGVIFLLNNAKQPFVVLSLSIPLSALVAKAHGTKQTAMQIAISKKKNNIDLYHSHRKELFSYFGQIGEHEYCSGFLAKFYMHPKVHLNYFKGRPEDGIPQINDEAFEVVDNLLASSKMYLDMILSHENPIVSRKDLYFVNFCPLIGKAVLMLGVREVSQFVNENGKRYEYAPIGQPPLNLLTIGARAEHAVAIYRYVNHYFQSLCDFCGYKRKQNTLKSSDYIDDGVEYLTAKFFTHIEAMISGLPYR